MTTKRLIHLVDDEEAIRKSVGFLLRTAGFSVEAWPSGVAFLKAVEPNSSACVLLDVRMPEVDGLEVQQRLQTRGITLPVIMLTGHGDVTIAVRAMKAGAVDFIEKPFEKSVLLAAIGAAFDQVDDVSAHHDRAAKAVVRLAALTTREQDVLKGLADGLPNKSIAYDLGISPRTVEVHRANLMTKLAVRSLSDALRMAFAAGYGVATA